MMNMRLTRPLVVALALSALPAAFLGLGCSADPAPPAQVIPAPGQLMLALRTDLMPGKDFNELRVLITQDGRTNDTASFTWTVTEGLVRGSVKLPTTVAVIRGPQSTGLTSIRAVAYRDGHAAVVRDISVEIPASGAWLLPVRIEALCVNEITYGPKRELRSMCHEGATCAMGECVAAYVDSRTLAPYKPEDVFGGAKTPGDPGGACVDILQSFSGGFDVQPRLEGADCVLSARDFVKPIFAGDAGSAGSAGDAGSAGTAGGAGDAGSAGTAGGAGDAGDAGVEPSVQFTGNIALRQSVPGLGTCTTDACLVPSPKGGSAGWSLRGPRVLLPRAVCNNPSPRVSISLRGPSFDSSMPTCGEWSSAGPPSWTRTMADPIITKGDPCSTAANLCRFHLTTCGNLWVADRSCDRTRLIHCGPCTGGREGMVRFETGEFIMGSPAGVGSDDEHPEVPSVVASFFLDKTEVTAAAYSACMSAGVCPFGGGLQQTLAPDGHAMPGQENHPVNYVSWFGASQYCSWKGLRLPSEVEWEYAARGGPGGTRNYPWGSEVPTSSSQLGCGYNLTADETFGTCAAGAYPRGNTAEGLVDMAGNVWEWTSSPYDDSGHALVGDPQVRTEKGSCWTGRDEFADHARSAFRSSDDMYYRSRTVGFRCARDD